MVLLGWQNCKIYSALRDLFVNFLLIGHYKPGVFMFKRLAFNWLLLHMRLFHYSREIHI